MGVSVDVHTKQEVAGERAGARALERSREARSLDIAAGRAQWSLESLSDAEFDELLRLDRLREQRTKAIIKNRLTDGVHYGTVSGIPKPFAWEGTADEILKLSRWTAHPVEAPAVVATAEYVEATVTVGVYDLAGRLLATSTRACSTFERRFKKRNGPGWKFDDPRECVNECVAMAAKRGKIAATLQASSAKAMFANPDQLAEDDDAEAAARAAAEANPWTTAERKAVQKALVGIGLRTKPEAEDFIRGVLGRLRVGTGADVHRILEAIAARQSAATKPIADQQAVYGEGAPAAAAQSDADDDNQALDLELAGE